MESKPLNVRAYDAAGYVVALIDGEWCRETDQAWITIPDVMTDHAALDLLKDYGRHDPKCYGATLGIRFNPDGSIYEANAVLVWKDGEVGETAESLALAICQAIVATREPTHG